MKKLFIIHGWTYTLDAWNACLGELRARGFEPVMLRVPGLTEPSDKVWTLDQYVAWLEEKLAGEKDILLAGHSNGGRIAIAYAAKNPPELQKLILIDAAGIVHNEAPLRAKRKVFGTLAKIGKPLGSIPFVRKIYYRLIGAGDYERAPLNMRETMKGLIARDLSPELSHIKKPTLIIWGLHDEATPFSDAKVMQEKIQGSKLVTIEAAAHSPHKTHPKETADAIEFFAG